MQFFTKLINKCIIFQTKLQQGFSWNSQVDSKTHVEEQMVDFEQEREHLPWKIERFNAKYGFNK